MNIEEFKAFLKTEIEIAQTAIEHGKPSKDGKPSRSDESSRGKLCVYNALFEYVNGKPSSLSLGVVGALNDTFQKVGRVEKGETILSVLQK